MAHVEQRLGRGAAGQAQRPGIGERRPLEQIARRQGRIAERERAGSKYPPAKPGALKIGPLKAARPSLTRLVLVGRSEERREETLTRLRYWAA